MTPSYSSRSGSALIAILGLMLGIICLVGFGSLMTRQAWRETTSKVLHQAVADATMQTAPADLRAYISDQLSSQASADLSKVPVATEGGTQTHGGQTSFYHLHSAQSTGSTLTAIQSSGSLHALTDQKDPFYGLKAATTTFRYRPGATLSATSPLGKRAGRDLQADLAVEIRQFPLSQFSQFYPGNQTLNATGLSNLGRTHANGNLSIQRNVTATWPLTVAGKLQTAPGVTVSGKQQPDSTRTHTVSSATTIEARRALMNHTIVDNDILASGITLGATFPEMLQAPTVNLGSTHRNAQKLANQCDVRISHQHSTNVFSATRSTGTTDSATQTNLSLYTGSLASRASGRPVIEFDIARLDVAGSRWNSYYLSSSHSNAIIMIRNAKTLPRHLSIVTPHDVWVEEDLNTPSNPAQIRSASIVTSGKVTGVAE